MSCESMNCTYFVDSFKLYKKDGIHLNEKGERSKVKGQRSKVKGRRSKVKGERSKVKGQR